MPGLLQKFGICYGFRENRAPRVKFSHDPLYRYMTSKLCIPLSRRVWSLLYRTLQCLVLPTYWLLRPGWRQEEDDWKRISTVAGRGHCSVRSSVCVLVVVTACEYPLHKGIVRMVPRGVQQPHHNHVTTTTSQQHHIASISQPHHNHTTITPQQHNIHIWESGKHDVVQVTWLFPRFHTLQQHVHLVY